MFCYQLLVGTPHRFPGTSQRLTSLANIATNRSAHAVQKKEKPGFSPASQTTRLVLNHLAGPHTSDW
jgi:hypothetical protein